MNVSSGSGRNGSGRNGSVRQQRQPLPAEPAATVTTIIQTQAITIVGIITAEAQAVLGTPAALQIAGILAEGIPAAEATRTLDSALG